MIFESSNCKHIESEGRIKHEENKLNEIQESTSSDDQRKMNEDKIKKFNQPPQMIREK